MSATQVNFIETAANQIYTLVITKLEENVKEPLYPGDERRIYGEGFVAVVVALFNTMNDQARQSLLRYARGIVLDAMGERVDTPRLDPTAAKTVLRFAVMQPLTKNVIIPLGTMATADSTLYFATTEPAVLTAGDLFVDVPAESTVGGADANGYKAGTVSTMVDLIPYISSVTNLSETSGATDGEPYTEAGDDNYRERIRLAPARFSTAGPEAAYEYHALSADPGIQDVRIVSDQLAGTINIVVLMEDGTGPSDDVATAVLNAANSTKVRPLNDLVTVDAPTFVDYDIELHYYVTQETEDAAIETIEGAGGAIDQYKEWQGGAIGRPINPDKLRALVLCPHWESSRQLVGAIRVDVSAPAYQEIGQRGVARFSGIAKVTHSVVKE